jgi:hypothetical protein
MTLGTCGGALAPLPAISPERSTRSWSRSCVDITVNRASPIELLIRWTSVLTALPMSEN